MTRRASFSTLVRHVAMLLCTLLLNPARAFVVAPTTTTTTMLRAASFYDTLLSRFQGDFDNHCQVLDDEKAGLSPGPGGGHEHIHATLVPLSVGFDDDAAHCVLAGYYLDGVPSRLFRFRLYKLLPQSDRNVVLLQLYAPTPGCMAVFRACAGAPTTWEAELRRFRGTTTTTDDDDPFTLLAGCDVSWTPTPDPLRHAYYQDTTTACHAVMINESGPILNSTVTQGRRIRVKDELSLTSTKLWINDRGFDAETGAFVYGNQRGVPYVLDKVAEFVVQEENNHDDDTTIVLTRKVVEDGPGVELTWTLGMD